MIGNERPEDMHGNDGPVSSGVEALIGRLKEEGVAEGRSQAQIIVSEAESRARWLVEQAKGEAEIILENARVEAQRLMKSSKDALRVSARDTLLAMKNTLTHQFTAEVERLVSNELKDETFLRRLILEVAARVRQETGLDEEERVEILLPRDVVGLEDLRRKPEELKKGTLSHFVLAVAGDVLREGVSFKAAKEGAAGVQVQLVDKEIKIDLTERAVVDLLLQHLQPRFRALLEGIIK